jgi:hypothetical protein
VVKDYLDGAITQLKARVRHLLRLVPRDLPRDVDALVVLGRERIMSLQNRLDDLLEIPEFAYPEHQGLRLRRYRRALEDLDLIESVVVAALMRWNEHDQRMNRLVGQITREIRFPLPTPVVSCISPWSGYYHTYPNWNLVVLPLAESQFLLHLPDLYHELAHALLDNDADPMLDPIQNALHLALAEVHGYLAEQIDKEQRRDGPRSLNRYLDTWRACWEDWLIARCSN